MSREFRFASPLYPIADALGRRDHVGMAAELLAAGARFLQLRVKDLPSGEFLAIAREVAARARKVGAQLIINDRVDIALAVDAAGVHLGQTDLPVAVARRLLGPEKVVGFSTHTLDQAVAAAGEGIADYIGLGPIYGTTSKKDPDPVIGIEGLRGVRPHVSVPIVAIGGIDASRAPAVCAAGADAVAMIGALAAADDLPGRYRAIEAALRTRDSG